MKTPKIPNLPLFALLVAAVLVLLVLVGIIAYRLWQNHRRRQCAEDYVKAFARNIPDRYYDRELIRAFYTSHFGVPDNFLTLGEPGFAIEHLGWMLAMTERLGPTTILNASYLRPGIHSAVAVCVSPLEFWVDFSHDNHRWAIWYPEDTFALIDRFIFGSRYVSSTSQRRQHDEVVAWLRRHNS